MKLFKMKLPTGWYPTNAEACRIEIQSFLAGFSHNFKASLGGITPHAGWDYSGRLAARVFSILANNNPNPDAVCIVGGHLASYHPVLFLDMDEAQTPLGNISINQNLTQKIIKNLKDTVEDPNEGDNTIEVLLPMVKYFFPQSPLISFRAPTSTLAKELGDTIAKVAQEENLNILVIASADLTHYGPNYNFIDHGIGEEALHWVKMTNDKEIVDFMLLGDINGVLKHGKDQSSTCSSGAIATALAFGKKNQFSPSLVEYHTSYDIYASTSFVGYSGIVF